MTRGSPLRSIGRERHAQEVALDRWRPRSTIASQCVEHRERVGVADDHPRRVGPGLLEDVELARARRAT